MGPDSRRLAAPAGKQAQERVPAAPPTIPANASTSNGRASAEPAPQVRARPAPAAGPLRAAALHAPAVLVSLGVAVLGSAPVAVAWFAACRLGYVLFVASSLRRESRRPERPDAEREATWLRFRARASLV